jgi:hypothetical protein
MCIMSGLVGRRIATDRLQFLRATPLCTSLLIGAELGEIEQYWVKVKLVYDRLG